MSVLPHKEYLVKNSQESASLSCSGESGELYKALDEAIDLD